MTIISKAKPDAVKKPNKVNGITADQKTLIQVFLQGHVYCWCKNRPNEWFAIRDLVGGENWDWKGTPLMPLHEKHEKKKDVDPIKLAGRDCGRLLKHVLFDDNREFETKKGERTLKYRWIPK